MITIEAPSGPTPYDEAGPVLTTSSSSPDPGFADDDREALVEIILDAAPDGLLVVDRTGRIVLVNSGLAKMFGYTAHELLGRTVEVLVPLGSAAAHVAMRARFMDAPAARAMSAHQALSGRRKDGELFDIEASLSPFELHGRPYAMAAVRDVTDRRRTEARAFEAEREVEVVGERERIARDLHDTVIQDLFATGMALQATLPRVDDRVASERIGGAIDALDDTIRRIRTVIFGLTAHSSWGRGVRGEILKIVADDGKRLGFEPSVSFAGALDELPAGLAEALVAVVREGMSNVVRHAGATGVDLRITASDELTVMLRDNGVGVDPDAVSGRGVDNMRSRADELGGTLRLEPGQEAGTVLTFTASLSH